MRNYLTLLKLHDVRLLLLVSFPARVCQSMVNLTIFFHVESVTGSITLAGFASGCYQLSLSLSLGYRALLIEKFGQQRPLLMLVPLYSLMVFSYKYIDSTVLLLTLPLFMGMASPPINLSVRPLWKAAAPIDLLRTSYALDLIAINITTILGPVLATTLAFSSRPETALELCALLQLVGGLGLSLTAVSRSWVPESKDKKEGGIWKSKGLQILAIQSAGFGIAAGAFSVGIPAFTLIEGVPKWSAVVFTGMAVASVFGGLMSGLISRKTSPVSALILSNGLWALITVPFVLTHADWSLLTVAIFYGFFTGILRVFFWEVIEAVRPAGTALTAVGMLWTVEGLCIAIGAAAGGWSADNLSPRATLLMITISISISFITILVNNAKLKSLYGIHIESSNERAQHL